MSLNIMIGSEPQDYVNIKNTIHFLDALTELKPVGLIDAEQSQILNDLIDWYKSLYDVMTNPSLANQEMYDPKELID
jgi:hypothetical protein